MTAPTPGVQTRTETLLQIAAADRAAKTPLPGKLAEAFAPDELKVHGFTIRPVVAADYIIFEKLSSPVKEEICKDAEDDSPTLSVEDLANTAFQFTRSAKECLKLLRSGKDAYIAAAQDFAAELSVGQLQDIATAIFQMMAASNGTVQTHEATGTDKEKVDFLALGGSQTTA